MGLRPTNGDEKRLGPQPLSVRTKSPFTLSVPRDVRAAQDCGPADISRTTVCGSAESNQECLWLAGPNRNLDVWKWGSHSTAPLGLLV